MLRHILMILEHSCISQEHLESSFDPKEIYLIEELVRRQERVTLVPLNI